MSQPDQTQTAIDTRYTRVEEWLNAATHGVGAALGIAGLVFLILRALADGRDGSLLASVLYGSALVFLFLASALHHAIPGGRAKHVFLSLDHSGIYLLIAGTYTPFCLLMPEGTAWMLLVLIWSLAGIGIAVQTTAFIMGHGARYEKIGFALHLAMSWIPILFAGKHILGALMPGGFYLLLAGGIAYSVGVIFYKWKRLPYNHAIWHLFVVGGSAFHFFSIFLYVIPVSV
jgi:hemolysin III